MAADDVPAWLGFPRPYVALPCRKMLLGVYNFLEQLAEPSNLYLLSSNWLLGSQELSRAAVSSLPQAHSGLLPQPGP